MKQDKKKSEKLDLSKDQDKFNLLRALMNGFIPNFAQRRIGIKNSNNIEARSKTVYTAIEQYLLSAPTKDPKAWTAEEMSTRKLSAINMTAIIMDCYQNGIPKELSPKKTSKSREKAEAQHENELRSLADRLIDEAKASGIDTKDLSRISNMKNQINVLEKQLQKTKMEQSSKALGFLIKVCWAAIAASLIVAIANTPQAFKFVANTQEGQNRITGILQNAIQFAQDNISGKHALMAFAGLTIAGLALGLANSLVEEKKLNKNTARWNAIEKTVNELGNNKPNVELQ